MERSMSSTALGIAPRLAPRLAPAVPEDHLFMALLNGYRSSGGLHRLTTLHGSRQHAWDLDVRDKMPRQVAERRILGIVWNHEVWVPDFQFEVSGAIKPEATAVFLELVPGHDPSDLGTWFITPSTWLQDDRPIDLLETAPARALAAARADRYLANWG